MEILAALFVSFFAVFALKPLSERMQLVDTPCDRKQHTGSIPLIGGLAVFLATLTACLLSFPNDNTITLYLIASALLVGLGTLDDSHDLSVRLRLVAQTLIACIVSFGAGLYIHTVGNLFGFGVIEIGAWGAPLMAIPVIGAINAFNMIDGIDGLAGSMALNSFAAIAVLLALASETQYIALPIILIVAIIPYLLFNMGYIPGPVKKIFMGDAGSMFIGFSVVCLLTLGSQTSSPAFRTVTALWIIALPLLDMAAIIMRRVRKGQSAFKPDRDHLHHIFVRAGFSSHEALTIMVLFAAFCSAIGILGEVFQVPEAIMFYGFIGLLGAYSYSINHAWRLVKMVRVFRSAKHLPAARTGKA